MSTYASILAGTPIPFFFKDFIYLFFREGRGGRNNVWLPLTYFPPQTWPATQAYALDWELNQQPFNLQAGTEPLSHTSQGRVWF